MKRNLDDVYDGKVVIHLVFVKKKKIYHKIFGDIKILILYLRHHILKQFYMLNILSNAYRNAPVGGTLWHIEWSGL